MDFVVFSAIMQAQGETVYGNMAEQTTGGEKSEDGDKLVVVSENNVTHRAYRKLIDKLEN